MMFLIQTYQKCWAILMSKRQLLNDHLQNIIADGQIMAHLIPNELFFRFMEVVRLAMVTVIIHLCNWATEKGTYFTHLIWWLTQSTIFREKREISHFYDKKHCLTSENIKLLWGNNSSMCFYVLGEAFSFQTSSQKFWVQNLRLIQFEKCSIFISKWGKPVQKITTMVGQIHKKMIPITSLNTNRIPSNMNKSTFSFSNFQHLG